MKKSNLKAANRNKCWKRRSLNFDLIELELDLRVNQVPKGPHVV